MDAALRKAALAQSMDAYVTALKGLTNEQLAQERRILLHVPELQDVLEREISRRKAKAAGA